MPSLAFWYDFASTYSYPAAMRLEKRAEALGVNIIWRPFLLGPIFVEQGWRDSPFNLYPAKGRYMWRDMARICAADGLAFQRPPSFPQNSLLAARIALTLDNHDRAQFSRAVYAAQFGEGKDIADAAALTTILNDLRLPPAALFEQAATETIKKALKAHSAEAKQLGLFGAPSFVAEDGEIFWGNDRLDAALDWALRANAKKTL